MRDVLPRELLTWCVKTDRPRSRLYRNETLMRSTLRARERWLQKSRRILSVVTTETGSTADRERLFALGR